MGGKLSSVWPSAVGIIVLTSFLGAYGAQKGPPYSGFLEAYPEMEPLKGVAGAFFYRQPEVDFSTYKKVMVDPVEVQLKPPEKEPAGGSEKDATAITGGRQRKGCNCYHGRRTRPADGLFPRGDIDGI